MSGLSLIEGGGRRTTMVWVILIAGFVLFVLLVVDVLRIMMDR
jgi:uncharacterized integral membrane protein